MIARKAGVGLTLDDDQRVAVVGGGPAGSFFSFFILSFAERIGRSIAVDIYEPQDFNAMGPLGCNMCGGIVSESLVQSLAMEGINLPDSTVQRGIDSYVMHTEAGTHRIETPTLEKRIAAVHRGGGPRTAPETKWDSFDNHLLQMAAQKGAKIHPTRVAGLAWKEGKPEIQVGEREPQKYDLLVGALGVNSPDLKLFENLGFYYRRPKVVRTFIAEIALGSDSVRTLFGSSMHVFLLKLPQLDFAALIPKGDFVTLCLLGSSINQASIHSFLEHPEVQRCFPPGWCLPKNICRCSPKMSVGEADAPFADRVVLVGDCAASRLYKDGIGAAFRTAKAAARTAIFSGISAEAFARGYLPSFRKIARDNRYGKIIFSAIHQFKRMDMSSRLIMEALIAESRKSAAGQRMGAILWDMFTGSAPYRDIFYRFLHPGFLAECLSASRRAFWDRTPESSKGNRAKNSMQSQMRM
jgi:flavin-dependent dehydrogenase